MKETKRITLCGVMTALACVLMYIGAVTDIFSLTACIFAAFAVLFIYVEYGLRSGIMVYASISVISLLILPEKLSAVLFTAYVGYYPMLKLKIEKLKSHAARWAVKLLSFNIMLAAAMLIGRLVLLVEYDSFWLEAATAVIANAAFILSDILATRLIFLYINKYRQILRKHGFVK